MFHMAMGSGNTMESLRQTVQSQPCVIQDTPTCHTPIASSPSPLSAENHVSQAVEQVDSSPAH